MQTLDMQCNLEPKIISSSLVIFLKEKTGKDLSAPSFRNYINSLRYGSHFPCKKPFIKKMNKTRRLALTKQWIFWKKDDWNKVIFSDQSKFYLFCSDGRVRAWKNPVETYLEKNLNKTVKYGGGSFTVWGCMSNFGVGQLVFL